MAVLYDPSQLVTVESSADTAGYPHAKTARTFSTASEAFSHSSTDDVSSDNELRTTSVAYSQARSNRSTPIAGSAGSDSAASSPASYTYSNSGTPRSAGSVTTTPSTRGRRQSDGRRALLLTSEEKQSLISTSTALLTDLVTSFEAHVYDHKREMDAAQWKVFKKKDHLTVFKQHAHQHRKIWQLRAEASHATTATGVPAMAGAGTIPGQLDDLLYGLVSHTTREMKMQGADCHNTLQDAAILATIEGPTRNQPFRFLGIKWRLETLGNGGGNSSSSLLSAGSSSVSSSATSSSSSSSSKSLHKKRELLFLESMGTTALSTGQRIGYRIQQSVDFNTLTSGVSSSSSSTVRASLCICQLFRQRANGTTLEVFMRGYYDPQGGRVARLMAANVAADILLTSPSHAVDTAVRKKLAWSTRQCGQRRRASTELDSRPSPAATATACFLCDRECSGLLHRGGVACMACNRLVCRRCSAMKTLSFAMGHSLVPRSASHGDDGNNTHELPPVILPDDDEDAEDVRRKALPFCKQCIVTSGKQNARRVAVDELVARGVLKPVAPGDEEEQDEQLAGLFAGAAYVTDTMTGSRPRQRCATTESSKRMASLISISSLKYSSRGQLLLSSTRPKAISLADEDQVRAAPKVLPRQSSLDSVSTRQSSLNRANANREHRAASNFENIPE